MMCQILVPLTILLSFRCLPSFKIALLLAIAIWSFSRAYYFAFYVIQHFVDPTYHFAGLWAFFKYVIGRAKN